MKCTIFSAILFITFAICSGQQSELIAEQAVYFDESVALLVELQTLIPEAQAELAALIPPLECIQNSTNRNDIPGTIKCIEELDTRELALLPKYYPYPKLLLLLNWSGILNAKNKFILSQGIGTIENVGTSLKIFTDVWREAVEDLRATKGTYLDNNYNSAVYFKNLCQREIRSNCNSNAKCTN